MIMLSSVGLINRFRTLFLLILINFNSACANKKEFVVKGETNYSIEESEELKTNLTGEFKKKIYETKNKNLQFSYIGSVESDINHFNQEIKTNAYSGLGIEF